MSTQRPDDRVDVPALQEHLSEALDSAEDESAKYHLREAYQKTIILTDE